MDATSSILLQRLQHGLPLSRREQMKLTMQLSVPAILAQLSTILMEYIDASMVGNLGAAASASIGLVSTTTWLLGGLCSSAATGFAVQVAQLVGARKSEEARGVFRQSLAATALFSLLVAALAAGISPFLPHWLRGGEEICHDASVYFFLFACCIPLYQMDYLLSGMLRSAGNMRVPSIINVGMCILNVAMNYLFIFRMGWGVLGAGLGSLCSVLCSCVALGYYVFFCSPLFGIVYKGNGTLETIVDAGAQEAKIETHAGATSGTLAKRGGMQKVGVYVRKALRIDGAILRRALTIALPMAIEHVAICSGHIFYTVIVAQFGTTAIASIAFGITIEGLCYMPGYGIGDAATTLIGQSIGAKRQDLQRSFSYISLLLGVLLMSVMGGLMYVGVPYLMPLMTPDMEVRMLTVQALRIEAFAEPFYAASIVAYGAFVGAADTKVPCFMNLGSIWLVRIPLALLLIRYFGYMGVWIAMAIELTFRGTIFTARLVWKNRQPAAMTEEN